MQSKNFSLFVLFSSIFIGIISHRAEAFITLKTRCWKPLQLQIAWDETCECAQVRGASHDAPRRPLNTPHAEEVDVTVSETKPFDLYARKGRVTYVAIAQKGVPRLQQLVIPVNDGATLWINDLGKGDIAIERPIDLINTTDELITVNVVRPETELRFVRKNYELLEDEELFEYQKFPWTRKYKEQSIVLAPANIPFSNGCLSQSCGDSLSYRLYSLVHQFMPNTHEQAVAYALAGGFLRIAGQHEQQVNGCSLSNLVPLTGEQDVIELSSQKPVATSEEYTYFSQFPSTIERANKLCGFIPTVTIEQMQQQPPYVIVHQGATRPELNPR